MTTRDCAVIAHRGASAYAPENTFAAFDLAIQMGVSHIELDVHATLDSHIVVIHDETVDRTTNGAGPVTSHTPGGGSRAGRRTSTETPEFRRSGGVRQRRRTHVSKHQDAA